jgi:hypothetical protein
MFANSRCSTVPSNGPFGWDNRTALSARKVSQDGRLNSAAYCPSSRAQPCYVAGLFAAFIVALLRFIYLKTLGNLTMRSDRMIASQMGVFTEYRRTGGWTRSGDLGRNCRGV